MSNPIYYTTEMLQKLDEAIATGARDIYYGDKRLSYRSLDEMMRIRTMIATQLGLQKTNGGRKLAIHSKGL